MKQFAVLSAARRDRGEALSAAARAFGEREGWPEAVSVRLPGGSFEELVAWGATREDFVDAVGGEAAVLLGLAAHDEDGTRLDGDELLRRVARSGPAALAAVASPQAFAIAAGGALLAATDQVGLGAVHHAHRDGECAASTSARLLASLFGRGLDDEAVSAFSVLGEYPGNDTPFRGVRRLAASEAVRVAEGRLKVEPYAAPPGPQNGFRDLDAVVAEGVEAVRAGVRACVDAYPEAAMEMSGGLDSRVILAALTAAGRSPSAGITLGEPSHPDVQLAGALARRAGVPFHHVDLAPLSAISPVEALALADRASRRRDYAGNAVALGVLEWVDGVTDTDRPRISGQNGELARGFYYPFQPAWPRISDGLVSALVRWRLMANERVSGELLEPGATAAGERRAAASTRAFLRGTGHDWLTATDLLYLHWRMQRWVGTDWSAASQTRPVLAPFFHPRYVRWALGAPSREKRGSRLLARVLEALDPELARIPLAGGEPPAVMVSPGAGHRVARAGRTAEKVGVKIRQRLSDSAKPPVGAPALAGLALAGMAEERTGLERVAALPFVNADYVERVAESRSAPPTTVGMLVALRGLAA